jgi:hypothetical protein
MLILESVVEKLSQCQIQELPVCRHFDGRAGQGVVKHVERGPDVAGIPVHARYVV